MHDDSKHLAFSENTYYTVINRFTNIVETIWNRCDHNDISELDLKFVEARERLEMEAGEAMKFDEQFRRDQYLLNNAEFFPGSEDEENRGAS